MRGLSWLSLAIRGILGSQLAYSGYAKATAFEWWRDLIVQMDIFPFDLTGVLSGALPGIELVLGVSLILGLFQRACAILSTLVFGLFTGIMVHLVLNHAPTTCGCFGPGSEYPVDWQHVAIDVAWMSCSVGLVFLPTHRFSLNR